MKKHFLIVFSLLAFLTMFLPAAISTEAAETADGAKVRVLHASPDAPAVDVYVNKDRILSGIKFKEISEYLPLEEGSYDIKIYAAGDKPKKAEAVLEENITVMSGEAYTVAASGKLEDLALAVYKDDLTAIEDEAKLRVIHLSPDAPKVDVYSLDTLLVSGLGFPEASEYDTLPAGEYSLDIRPAGQEEAVFNIPNVELKQGENYTAIAVGLLKGDPAFDVLLVKDK